MNLAILERLGGPRVWRNLLVGLLLLCVPIGWYTLYRLVKPRPVFIPVAQTFAEGQERNTGKTFFTASFPILDNGIARKMYFAGVNSEGMKDGMPKVWIANTERGSDFKRFPVSHAQVEFGWDPIPAESFLYVRIDAPVEALRCGDAEGNRTELAWLSIGRRGELETHSLEPGTKAPCTYNVVQIEYEDGRLEEYFIGELMVPPHSSSHVGQYIPRDYQPISVPRAWGVVGLYALALFFACSAPMYLAALLVHEKRVFYSLLALLLILSFTPWMWVDDYLILDDIQWRSGGLAWVAYMVPWVITYLGGAIGARQVWEKIEKARSAGG